MALNGIVDPNQVAIATVLINNALLFCINSHYVSSEMSGTLIQVRLVISSMNKYYGELIWKFNEWELINLISQGCDDSIIIFSHHP